MILQLKFGSDTYLKLQCEGFGMIQTDGEREYVFSLSEEGAEFISDFLNEYLGNNLISANVITDSVSPQLDQESN